MDIQEVTDPSVVLNMVSNGLGYTVLPTSFILPQISSDSSPYRIIRLGPDFPTRMIHLVYSASYQFSLTIHDITEMISSPYKTSMEQCKI
ncbi:MAG: hypothetical protein K0S39_3461 [Paenibacillus sp.]|jgi:DNA-binding transcriptional LysR family regulator|nr:hypothetical protein [Paenibacillus sp.]